jgi:hypothetical protein
MKLTEVFTAVKVYNETFVVGGGGSWGRRVSEELPGSIFRVNAISVTTRRHNPEKNKYGGM